MTGRRRFLAILVFALLLTPCLLTGFPANTSSYELELRPPARFPSFPMSWKELRSLPRAFDAYARDHFGLRDQMIRAHAIADYYALGAGNDQVLETSKGRYFFYGDEMIEQSAGLLVRRRRIDETAVTISQIAEKLARRHIRLVVAPPPNASTILIDDLPTWARNDHRVTEYDILGEALRQRDVYFVDLRPALRSGDSESLFAKHDTHWSALGALTAFNAITSATGHAGWHLSAGAVLSAPKSVHRGDLARMLDLEHWVEETVRDDRLTWGTGEDFAADPYPVFTRTKEPDAPTLMIIGDSFTYDFLAPFVVAQARRFAFVHYRRCGFDWHWIDVLHPEEVWLMPTERLFLCDEHVRPAGML